MRNIIFFTSLIIYTCCFGQQTLTLQPDATNGIDAYLHSGGANGSSSTNYGTHKLFAGNAGTNSGQPIEVRNLLSFDLSALPPNAIISSAKLSLYGVNAPWSTNTVSHYPHGSNQSYLKEITQPWDESTVTWNNQPLVSSVGVIVLPATTTNYEDFLNINVTDAIIGLQQGTNYGLRLSMANTVPYHRVFFGSSDQTDSTKRPKLVIEYDTTCAPTFVSDIHTVCDSFTWNNGQTYYSDNSQDQVILTSVSGCDSIVELDLTINSVDVSYAGVSNLILNDPLGIDIIVYKCDKEEGEILITGINQISQLSSLASGDYSLEIYDNNTGCSGKTPCFSDLPTLSSEEYHLDNSIQIQNNTIRFLTENINQVVIYDITGKVFLSVNNPTNEIKLPSELGLLIIDIQSYKARKVFKWLPK